MTSEKKRRKARRHVERTMREAFEAVANGEPHLALKLSRRAVDDGQVNPRIWVDHGRVARLCGDDVAAEAAFRHAIGIAPRYTVAFAELAALQGDLGKLPAAARLMRRALDLDDRERSWRRQLEKWETAVADDRRVVAEPVAETAPEVDYTDRTVEYDWDAIAAELLLRGVARLPALCSRDECTALMALWSEPSRFEHVVARDDEGGRLEYRFLQPPLPEPVASLRAELYGRCVRVANAWESELGRSDRYPVALEDFQARCHGAGQSRSTPIVIHYPDGGFNGLHQDVAGSVVFPLQLAVTLGPGGTSGGEFVLADRRPGKKVRRRVVATRPGDGVVFCSRERLVKVGGVYGLQPVAHGVTEVSGGERFALGVPFHEHG